jgi:hypothetical protein
LADALRRSVIFNDVKERIARHSDIIERACMSVTESKTTESV